MHQRSDRSDLRDRAADSGFAGDAVARVSQLDRSVSEGHLRVPLGAAACRSVQYAGGWLSGRYDKGGDSPADSRRAQMLPSRYDMSIPGNQAKLEAAQALGELAQEAGITLIEMALGFVTSHPAVSAAIIGPRTMEQLESQLPALETKLSGDVLDRIDEIVPPGTQYQMVITAEQAAALNRGDSIFGGWATTEIVPDQAFARNNLNILAKYKKDVSYVITVKTTDYQQLNSGQTLGGASQVQFLGKINVRPVGPPQRLH